jgi:site-specific DNA-methyltransferase (adenine-specific)
VRDFTTLCYDKCQGILALHGNDYLCEQYLTIAAFRAYCRISWCNWYYAFGQCTRENWIDSRCHLLLYTNVPEYTWNPESVLVDSARVGYGDNRIFETENGGKRLPGTVWGIGETYFGRIQGNNKERREKHPNQLPELYLARIIKAYTNEGDWILDPFGGSGTTAVVAQALGRNCVTIEISEESCVSIRERLEKGAVRC